MNPIRFALVLPLCVPVAAQVTVTAVTDTPVAVMIQGPTPAFNGVGAGQPADTLYLQAPASGSPLTNVRCLTTTGTSAPGFVVGSLVLGNSTATGLGTTTALAPAGATFGRPALVATLQAPPGTTGRLNIRFTLGVSGPATAPVHDVSLDIGNDGSVEFAASATTFQSLPLAVPASGQVQFRATIENHCAPTAATSYRVQVCTLDVRFVQDPLAVCTISTYGTSCGGAQAAASELTLGNARTITLLGTGGFGNAPMVALFGDQNTGPTLPGGCALLTNALGSTLLLADQFGHASVRYNLPATAVGTVYLQMVPFDLQGGTLAVRASNGVQVDCAP